MDLNFEGETTERHLNPAMEQGSRLAFVSSYDCLSLIKPSKPTIVADRGDDNPTKQKFPCS